MAQTPDQIAARWAQNLAGSTQKIKDGINSVTVAPGQAAARQVDVWAQNTMSAKDKWKARVASVSLADWQAAAAGRGVDRIGSGAQAAIPKFQSFMTQFMPFVQAGRNNLPPRGTLDQNINRAVAMMRHNASFKRSGQ